MASTSVVSGLVSGLDTATIVNQLIAVEANQQTLLKSQQTAQKAILAKLQSLNASTAAIGTAAGALTKPDAWNVRAVTSSVTGVNATATAAAFTGNYQFTVSALASAHQLSFGQTAAPTDVVVSGGTTVSVTDSQGKVTSVDTGDGTMAGLVSAINSSGLGIRARTLTLDDGTQRLSVVSTKTGAAGSFTLTSGDGSALLGGATVTAGQDAAITVGSDTIHSATNTFANVFSGVTFTVGAGTATGTTVDLTVKTDTSAVKDKVDALVKQVNSLLTDIDAASANSAGGAAAGVLSGNREILTLRDQLLDTVVQGVGGASLATVGIEVTRDGRLSFDADKFSTALDADPGGTQALFAPKLSLNGSGQAALVTSSWRTAPGIYAINATVTGGLVSGTIDGAAGTGVGSILTASSSSTARELGVSVTGSANGTLVYTTGFAASLERVAKLASGSTSGSITASVTSTNSRITTLGNSIDAWDVRLTARREALEKQYAALETALSKLQSQSQWLNGQISSLNASSSS
jgi:flagellar hook-associated protein 2